MRNLLAQQNIQFAVLPQEKRMDIFAPEQHKFYNLPAVPGCAEEKWI